MPVLHWSVRGSLSAFGNALNEAVPCLVVSEGELALLLLGEAQIRGVGEISVSVDGDFKVSGSSLVSNELVGEDVWHDLVDLVDQGRASGSVTSSSAVLDSHVEGSAAQNFVCHLVCFL